jgi:methionine-rich copper-binding protein CopC/photosystem II stability/assembly factor-like uncharacterized protein
MKKILFLFAGFFSIVPANSFARHTTHKPYTPSDKKSGNFLFFLICGCLLLSLPAFSQWQQIKDLKDVQINSILIKDTTLFVSTKEKGVFKSENNGTSWAAVNNGLTNTDIYSLVFSGNTLFASSNGGGIFKSEDNGASWTAANAGFANIVYNIVVKGTTLFAGTNKGVFKSENNGTSWTAVNNGLTNTDVFCFTVKNNTLFAGTKSGVFKSENNGTSWSAVNNGLTNTDVYSLAVSGNTVFAGTWGGGVFKSEDNGASWTAANTGLPNTYIRTFAVSGSTLYVSAAGAGIFKSENNGVSWIDINNNLPNKDFYSLAVNGTTVYAGSRDGLWVSGTNTAPVVTSFSPADNANDVDADKVTELIINFNRPVFEQKVKEGDKKISLRQNREPKAFEELNANSNSVITEGNKVIIRLKNPLPAGSVISVHIPQGLFIDADQNEYAGIADNDFDTWNFTTLRSKDTDRPVINSFFPAKDAKEVSPKTTLVLVFNEDIVKGAGVITINYGSTQQSINVASAAVSIGADKRTVTITPLNEFPSETEIHVLIEEGAFKDLSDNNFQGIINAQEWKFTTKDEKAPDIFSFNPTKGATNIDPDSHLEITFNEEIQKGQGRILLYLGSNPNPQILTVNDSRIIVNGNKVTIRPGTFPANTLISIGIEPGAFQDKAGNPHKGITDNDTWNFVTAPPKDITPPQVITFSPANNATDVAVDAVLTITFDEEVQAGEGNITILQGETSQKIAVQNPSVGISGNVVTIRPAQNFPSAATVHILIDKGAFTDKAGNPYAGIQNNTTWTFKVKDITPLQVTSFYPLNNATNIKGDISLEMEFNKPVIRGTGNITIHAGNTIQTIAVTDAQQLKVTGNKVVINPATDLPDNTKVYILITGGAFVDAAGNTYAGIQDQTTWNFTTAPPQDQTAPQIVSLLPLSGALGVAVSSELVIKFNEKVIKGIGNILLRDANGEENISIAGNQVSISDDVVTIRAAKNFPFATTVSVLIPSGGFKDLAGNLFAGITDANSWKFTTETQPDRKAPVIVALSPAKNAENVPAGSKLEITFDERVEKGSGTIFIHQDKDIQEINVESVAVTVQDNKVMITPPKKLKSKTKVYIQLAKGTFKDIEGNLFIGIEDQTEWTFRVADDTPPVVVSLSPQKNATNVPLNSTLEITFDEEIVKGKGQITINSGKNKRTVAVNSNAVTVDKNKAIIDPKQSFPPGTSIFVLIEPGAFLDKADNPFAGIEDNTTWAFRTAGEQDVTPPTVSSLSPANGATGVAPATDLVVTFSEPIKAATGNIALRNGTKVITIPVTDASQVNITENKLTINPTADMDRGVRVNVLIQAGAVTDLNDNPFAGIISPEAWQFTTIGAEEPKDQTAPSVVSYSPANNATGVAVNTNLELTFSENVQKATGTITITQGNTSQIIEAASNVVTVAGNKITINPAADLPYSSKVSIQISKGAFKDLAGNDFAGITDNTTWQFTTRDAEEPKDETAPKATAFSPADKAKDIEPGTNLQITFDEKVKAGTGTITLRVGNTTQDIAVNSAAVIFTDTKVLINPHADFAAGSTINVEIPEGAILDLAGNAFEGTDATTWSFITREAEQPKDNTAPLVSSVSPANGAVNVPAGANLVLSFNEKVKRNTGNFIIRINNAAQNMAITDAQVSVENNQITINPTTDFPAGAVVSVEIPSGLITDEAGNGFRGIAAGSWSFTIGAEEDKTPPAVTLLSPADNAANVPVNANLSITFNEPIKKGTGTITLSQNGFRREIPVTDQSVVVNGNTASVSMGSGFLPGANVFVLLAPGIFTDLAGNPYQGITVQDGWNFTVANTSDFSKPIVNSFSPPDNSTDVAANVNLVMTFNKPVIKRKGNIIITHGTSSQTIDVSSAAVTVAGETVTINPPADFPSESYVSVLIMPGVFADVANNAFEGILDADTWNFTIKDTKAPALISLFPADNATNIPANINLVLAFDEAIIKGSGQITISHGNTSQTIDINSESVIVSGSTVIINPPSDFPHDSQVRIHIPPGTFTDASGNAFAGLNGSSAWNLTISAFSDTTPPVAVSFSPADNASLVQANTNLEIVFSENVQKGSGTISIYQGNTSQTMDINSPDLLINGARVLINPPADFLFGSAVYVLIQEGAIKDLANNSYAGIADPGGWNFTVDASIPVRIVSKNFPEVILSSAANVEASIEVNRVPAGTLVELVSRGIAGSTWNRQRLNSSTVRFPASLAQSQFDEIGLEYYFNITLSSGVKIASDTAYTYIEYVGNGLDIPDLQFGATVDAYQMVSVPLELKNKEIQSVLEDNLNTYDIKKWRFFHYRNGLLAEYLNGLSTIETGNGYWLIARNPANINTGEGTTVKVRSSNPYTLRLKKGWNQIGNPYNFNISWNDVKVYNKLPSGLGNLRLFESEFKDSDILRKFRGAFVFAEQDMVIQIPVLKNSQANSRISAEQDAGFNLSSLWEVSFSLQSKDMNYRLGGAGMNPDADFSKDRFDDIMVPRFVKYLELNFRHPEYFAPKFTKDIRPLEPNQTWDFTVESNLAAQGVTLGWKKFLSDKMDRSKKLILYDITHDKAVDLLQSEQYIFHQDSLTQFKLFYGTPEYINENLQAYHTSLNASYPNPFRHSTNIAFRLSAASKSYIVRLQVYDLQGRWVAMLKEGVLDAGTHEVSWDGTDVSGRKLPPGMYIYKLEASSENSNHLFTQKLIIQ